MLSSTRLRVGWIVLWVLNVAIVVSNLSTGRWVAVIISMFGTVFATMAVLQIRNPPIRERMDVYTMEDGSEIAVHVVVDPVEYLSMAYAPIMSFTGGVFTVGTP